MPARIMLIGVGASTCASGSQVWNGNDGSLTMKPMKNRTKTHHWIVAAVIARLAGDLRQLHDVERVRP